METTVAEWMDPRLEGSEDFPLKNPEELADMLRLPARTTPNLGGRPDECLCGKHSPHISGCSTWSDRWRTSAHELLGEQEEQFRWDVFEKKRAEGRDEEDCFLAALEATVSPGSREPMYEYWLAHGFGDAPPPQK
eukprot:m51a1_g12373 hypothetical protein (135) ;mRNA; r:606329-606819